MNAAQAIDLHDVDAYWKSRNLVDDKHRPYCLRWLQRFLSGPWGAGRLAPNDALAAFAQHLEQDARTEEWQVRQAVRAVELFQKHYLRHLQETGHPVPAAVAGQVDAAGPPKTFAAALDETRTLIRLRHYALRTEQAYLGWLDRYGWFADQRALPWTATDSLPLFFPKGKLRVGRNITLHPHDVLRTDERGRAGALPYSARPATGRRHGHVTTIVTAKALVSR